jgi:hypothetical protein
MRRVLIIVVALLTLLAGTAALAVIVDRAVQHRSGDAQHQHDIAVVRTVDAVLARQRFRDGEKRGMALGYVRGYTDGVESGRSSGSSPTARRGALELLPTTPSPDTWYVIATDGTGSVSGMWNAQSGCVVIIQDGKPPYVSC